MLSIESRICSLELDARSGLETGSIRFSRVHSSLEVVKRGMKLILAWVVKISLVEHKRL